MSVAVIADDAAAVPRELATRLGIRLVPMQLEIGGRPVPTDQLEMGELVRHLDDGVQTSGPPPGAFVEAVTEAVTEGGPADGVVILTVAQRFSSTYQTAQTATRLLPEATPVRVVDTGTAAGGEGLVVLAAAQAARAGAPLEAVVAKAEEVRPRVRLVAAVDHLTYLVRGGRVPASVGRMGDRLGLRVLFELRDSHVRPLAPGRTRSSAVDQLLGHWRRSRPSGPHHLHLSALHALRSEEADQLLGAISAEVEPETAFIATFGAVMVAHTGPGVVGLAWWWEPAA